MGCSLPAYAKKAQNGKVELLQIEGDRTASSTRDPLPEGHDLTGVGDLPPARRGPMYRATGAKEWERVSWEFSQDELARNIKTSRDRTFVTKDADGSVVNR